MTARTSKTHVNACRRWTDAEDQFLRDNAGLPRAAKAKALGRTVAAINQRAQKLRTVKHLRGWTPAEIAILRECYVSRGARGVQLAMGLRLGTTRSARRIYAKARLMGLARRPSVQKKL